MRLPKQIYGQAYDFADPALSATLPSEVRGSGDRIAENKPKTKPLWMAAIVLGVAIGAGIAAIVGFDKKEPVVAPAPDPELKTVPKIIEPAKVVEKTPPPPTTVKIEVHANEGTQIIGPGGIVLGTAPATMIVMSTDARRTCFMALLLTCGDWPSFTAGW